MRRVSDAGGGRRQETRSFQTTTAALLTLLDWLRSYGVTLVGMESTGVYWSADLLIRARSPGPVNDPAAVKVVGRHLDAHAVAREDADPVAAHLPATWARTAWPLSSCTRNIAFGSASTTSPSNSIFSSFAN